MHPFIILLIRLVLGATWLTAGIAKLAAKEPRGEAVAQFGLLPRRASAAVGAALPYLELGLGGLLLAGLWTSAAAGASAALLALFGLAIGVNLIRGRQIECHCFGEMGRGPASWWSVLRNATLLMAALALVDRQTGFLAAHGSTRGGALRPGDPPPAELVPVLLIAIAGALAGVLVTSAWGALRAAAFAADGPALGTAERRLRRWLLRSAKGEGARLGATAKNGR